MSSVSSSRFHAWTQPLLVTITSIQTETVHPTWIYTLTQSTTLDVVSTTPTMFVTVSTLLSTTSTIVSETSLPALSPTSSPMENLPSSPTVESWATEISSSMHLSPPPISPSTSRVSSVETTSSTISSATSSTISSSPSSNIKTTTSSPSKTPSTPFIGIATSASTSTTNISSSTHPNPKAGLIIGTILGGTTALIFTLLAIVLCIRRRRNQTTEPRRGLGIKQRLLRGDSMSSTTYHPSTPTLPENMTNSPTLPTLPRPNYNHNLPPAYSNPDLSLDSMYLRRERAIQDHGIQPPSPVEISSRMASFCSTSSWDGDVGLQEYWDLERGELSKHDSMRSNPFDLEPPPSVHRSSVPFSTPWGVKF